MSSLRLFNVLLPRPFRPFICAHPDLLDRFRQNNDILPKLVEAFFPTLVTIATQALSNPPAGTNQEVPTLLHLILKTYSTSIILHLSAHQQSSESLVPWGRLLFQVVNLQIPKDAEPADEDERERSEWWKAKKWAYKILGRLFHRFGNPSQLPSSLQQDYGAFAQTFVTSFAPEIFKVYLHQTELYVSGQAWLSKKCQYRIFTFFTEWYVFGLCSQPFFDQCVCSVKPKSTWALLKPHVQNLVQSYVYPQLSFTPAKQEQWETDPVEFVRTSVGTYSLLSRCRFWAHLLSQTNTRRSTALSPPRRPSCSLSRATGQRRRSSLSSVLSTKSFSRAYPSHFMWICSDSDHTVSLPRPNATVLSI